MYLRELETEKSILNNTGVDVSVSSLRTFLHKSNFTHQRMRVVAKQQDRELREQYSIAVSVYKPHMLVFSVDETGSDCRDAIRKYGYGLRGRSPVSCKLLVRGERISAVIAMNEDGILAVKFVRGTVNGDEFLDFIQRDLLPSLMPFDGTNPNSIVIE